MIAGSMIETPSGMEILHSTVVIIMADKAPAGGILTHSYEGFLNFYLLY